MVEKHLMHKLIEMVWCYGLNSTQVIGKKKISVTKILLATHGNMQFDPTYEMVHVKDLTNINNFIQNQTKQFSDEEVKEIIISLGKIPKQTS